MIFSILSDRSVHWSKIQKEHIKQQPCCQACGTVKNLQVHHIIPFNVDPLKELDKNNLITLCKKCHFVFGHLMDYTSWNIDVIEDSKVYLNKVKNKPHKIRAQYHVKKYSFGIDSLLCWFIKFFTRNNRS